MESDRPAPLPSNPRVTSPAWRDLSGTDDHHELALAPDTILSIHRVSGESLWQASLFDSGSEESPFLLIALRSVALPAAKREAVRRAASMMSKLLEALSRAKVAA